MRNRESRILKKEEKKKRKYFGVNCIESAAFSEQVVKAILTALKIVPVSPPLDT